MSCYENLVMKTQMNYSRHYSTYASGGTAVVLSKQNPLSYEEQIQEFVRRVQEAECIIVGGASGLSAAGGGDFYYSDTPSFRKHFGKFVDKYGFKGAFSGMMHRFSTRNEHWGYVATFLNTTQNAPIREPYLDLDRILQGKGMLRSLIMKAYYKKDNNCQAQLDSLVSKIFGYIQTSEQWHYISNFFVDLCEVSPNSVLNKLEEEQINPTGLMELFENQSSDFLFGKNDYIEILWGVEEFLVQREYASRAYSWLLYLDNLSFEYKSNSPKDIFGKLLCTWHNFSAFSKSNDKIEIAAKALAKDKNAWDHIFGALPTGHASIFGDLHAPKYRNHVEEDTITRKEMYDTNLGYIDLLLKATDFKPQRWNDLLSIYDEVDPDIRKKIKEKLLFEIAQMDDDERLIIKNNIRRVVYKHRYFASAEWAMGEDLIGEMLDILDSINFTQRKTKLWIMNSSKNESKRIFTRHLLIMVLVQTSVSIMLRS